MPIRDGAVRGDAIYFSYDFSGETMDGIAVDTVYFRGSRRSRKPPRHDPARLLGGRATAVDIPFQVVREPAGF